MYNVAQFREVRKRELEVLAECIPCESSLPGLQTATIRLDLHEVEREIISPMSLIRKPIPFPRAPLTPLPSKGLTPKYDM